MDSRLRAGIRITAPRRAREVLGAKQGQTLAELSECKLPAAWGRAAAQQCAPFTPTLSS